MTEQRDVTQTVREVEYAATSATGNAAVYITNYYYGEETKVAPVKSANTAVDDNLPCPYRGLLHFSPNDAEFFFGREVFVEKLVQATAIRNFIPLLGASGSGKSSVVLAGLVPELQKQGNWLFTHFRPDSDPFQKLAEALVPLYAPELNETDRMAQTRKLANYLDKGEVILTDVIANIQRNYPHHRVLLIADQFEELYTLCGDEKTRQHFLDCLLTIIQSPKSASDSVVVTTMRADFLENALSYRPFVDVLQNDIKLGAMNREERKEVIEKPAQKLGVIFQGGLVERILEDVEQQPGSLPLLEFALTLLWEKRENKQLTHTAYEEIGEVKGALASHADQIYRNLNLSEQQQVRRIFMQLVRSGDGEGMEDTRRVATKSELGENNWFLVKHLADADARLVVTSQNAAQQVTVEVVHEALIRHWQLLRSWIDENRSKIIQKNRIERLAMEWRDNNQVKGYLLGGKQLNEAKMFQKKEAKNLKLSDLASDFIQKSIRHRRNNNFKLIGFGFIPLVALAVYLGFVVERNIRIARLREEVEAAKGQKDSPTRILALQELVEAGESLANISLEGANLSRATLSDANLSGSNLLDANLSGANLLDANLSFAFLYGAILNGTTLNGASLSGASLYGASLYGASLYGANLYDAILSGADLSGARLSGADLSGARLSRAKLSGATLGCEDIVVTEPPVCTNFQGVTELTPEQVKAAKDWDQACYDPEFRKKLGLSPENPKNCALYNKVSVLRN